MSLIYILHIYQKLKWAQTYNKNTLIEVICSYCLLNKRRPFHPRILLGIQLTSIKLPIFQSLLSTGDTLEDIITFIYWIRQNWKPWTYLWRLVYYTENHTLNKPHPILSQGPVSLQHISKLRQFCIKRRKSSEVKKSTTNVWLFSLLYYH